MKITECKALNFGSYSYFIFDFSNKGLCLVHGPTGSGKSTFLDMSAWCLYGVTAKDGNVDEVRSWNTEDSPTQVNLNVETTKGTISVTRIRGKSSQNDLFWRESDGHGGYKDFRGKDLSDTQKLLEGRLGVSSDSFLASSYFHEFSKAGTFFTAKAKDRRILFESVAPLENASILSDRIRDESRLCKSKLESLRTDISQLHSSIANMFDTVSWSKDKQIEWEAQQEKLIKNIKEKALKFEEEKANKIKDLEKLYKEFEAKKDERIELFVSKLESIPQINSEVLENAIHDVESNESRCLSCGGVKHTDWLMRAKLELAQQVQQGKDRAAYLVRLQEANDLKNPYYSQIQREKASENHLDEQLSQEINKINPHKIQVDKYTSQYVQLSNRLSIRQLETKKLEHRISSLTKLQSLVLSLRGEILTSTIKTIQDNTNSKLETFFDSAFRVEFASSGSDDLDVKIHNNGNACVYRQLSKGQRQLLKLCFATSVMQSAANHSGTSFGTIFLDEALDGLDSTLKVKAFGLLQQLELQHDSVFVIDHDPAFQTLFTKRYKVQLIGDESTMDEDNE